MNRELQQYRFARIEAHNVVQTRLESQFMSPRIDFEKLEREIEQELAEPITLCAMAQIRNRTNGLPRRGTDGSPRVLLGTSSRIPT